MASIKNNTFDLQANKVLGAAVSIKMDAGAEFTDNDMKVRVADTPKALDISGSGDVRRNAFDVESGKPSADETATRTVRGWTPNFRIPWLRKDKPEA